MANHTRNLPNYTDNPFNPGFGVRPPLLAGRQELLHDVLAGVNRGPGRHEFHTVLVGPRGTGKTVMLAEIERSLVAESQALIVHWSGTESLQQRVAEQKPGLDAKLRGLARRGLRRLEPELSIKAAPAGVGLEARIGGRNDPTIVNSVHSLLEQLGRGAAARHRIVVLVADELQAATPEDLRQLGVSIQQLANVQQLPVALIGAGLPHTQQAFQEAKVTFLERLTLDTIGLLDDADTRDAIEIPFVNAGRTIDAAALDLLAVASGGYPYAIQLVGSYCWEAAGEAETIVAAHARKAAKQTSGELERSVFVTTWQRIAPADRQYLIAAAAVADPTGVARTADIAARLQRPLTSTSPTRDRLINRHAALYAGARGTVQFTLPGFAAWLTRQTRHRVEELTRTTTPPPKR